MRSDMACGSTIGPILASSLGCRTVDVGAPQLSMHSIREMCGVDDVGHSYRHFLAFFQVADLSYAWDACRAARWAYATHYPVGNAAKVGGVLDARVEFQVVFGGSKRGML